MSFSFEAFADAHQDALSPYAHQALQLQNLQETHRILLDQHDIVNKAYDVLPERTEKWLHSAAIRQEAPSIILPHGFTPGEKSRLLVGIRMKSWQYNDKLDLERQSECFVPVAYRRPNGEFRPFDGFTYDDADIVNGLVGELQRRKKGQLLPDLHPDLTWIRRRLANSRDVA